MRSPSRRRLRPRFRPHLLPLEERLPLGDGILGLLVGASLLGTHAAAPAAVSPRSGEPGAARTGVRANLRSLTLPARQIAVLAQALSEAFGPAPERRNAADTSPFTNRHGGVHAVSPPREQGPDAPVSAPRAPEAGAAHGMAVPPPSHAASRAAEDALLATLAGMRPPVAPTTGAATLDQETAVKESFGRLPLSFEQNVGQTDASVHFFTRGPGYSLFLTSTEAVMVLNSPKAAEGVGQDSNPARVARQDWNPVPQETAEPPAVVRMSLVGANPTPAVTGRGELPGKVNYFLGNDPGKWHTNVSTFSKVEYDEVYSGIDLVYYGHNQQLEYDFVVAPGADPNVIRLNVSGAERLELDAAGDLLVHVGEPGGVSPRSTTLRQHKPFVYQEAGGARQEVASRFVLEGQQVRFAVAAYDPGLPLVIDPVLSYSTYLGGSGNETAYSIAVDTAGSAYVTGATYSLNFPTTPDAFQRTGGGKFSDIFVTKLSAPGSELVYSTYLGGSSHDVALGLATDVAGGAIVTGYAWSRDYPTRNALQPVYGGGSSDAIVTKLNAAGSALHYSSYLGGRDQEAGWDTVVDDAGSAYVTGYTYSDNFPATAESYQRMLHGNLDAFVAKLTADGAELAYCTYLGGGSTDQGYGIGVDPSGNAYVAGVASSPDFPTTADAFQPAYRGNNDGFVTKLNETGSALAYSSYLGGTREDTAFGLAVGAGGEAYVTGLTSSFDFPITPGAPQQMFGGGQFDAFAVKVHPPGTALAFSTYLGGIGLDRGYAIAVDRVGRAHVTGETQSFNFPTAEPFQGRYGGSGDAFVARLNGTGTVLEYSSYLGGDGTEQGRGISTDAAGSGYLTGLTLSIDFPTTPNAFQRMAAGTADGFVAKIAEPDTLPPSVTCSLDQTVLWPPNHELVNVGLGVRIEDDMDPNPLLHVLVFANDAADPTDAADVGPKTLRLRAERHGGGQGRVYLSATIGIDAAGNTNFDVCTAVVPHDRSTASLDRVTAAALAAEAYYRKSGQAPPGYALLGEGPWV